MTARVLVELHSCEICGRYYRPHAAEAEAPQGIHRCAKCAALMRPTPRDDGSREDWSARVEHECVECGADFLGARNQRLCPQCQERRKREAMAREIERRKARNGSTKPRGVCVDCGAPTSSTRHKRCAACAKIRRRKQVDAWWRKERHGPDAALMIPREAEGKDGKE